MLSGIETISMLSVIPFAVRSAASAGNSTPVMSDIGVVLAKNVSSPI